MIITKAPLRMSFVGGGSDMQSYYTEKTGSVISTSINKYVYVAVKPKFGNGFRISYSKTEICDTIGQIEHPIVKECLNFCGIDDGLEIVSMADIPSSGSGLGSSSSFTVALLKALYAYKNVYKTNSIIAEEACEIEINKCKEPIGKQDQYASAVGGLNKFVFNTDHSVHSEKVFLTKDKLKVIENHVLVLFTGTTRSASKILKDQSSGVQKNQDKQDVLSRMVQLVDPFIDVMYQADVQQIGKLLHLNWELKKQLSNAISDNWIDKAYQCALQKGALGGKILGAGAGGFFLFIASPDKHNSIASALGMKRIPMQFTTNGCEIIFAE